MPRAYGTTNASPYATTPAVGPAGDTYWNTTDSALYISDGTGWVATTLWRDPGTTLTPADPAKNITLPGDLATGVTLLLGSASAKGRLQVASAGAAGGNVAVLSNRDYLAGNTQDDATKPSWGLQLSPQSDVFVVQRTPPGQTAPTNLLTLDAFGQLTLWTYGASGAVNIGGALVKGHLVQNPVSDTTYLTSNAVLNAAGAAWVQDDATKPSWIQFMDTTGDRVRLNRLAPGGVGTAMLTVDNVGNLTINGPTATKAAPGTAWINPSDLRLKQAVADDPRGLDAICALRPVTYQFNGQGGTLADGQTYHGLIADEVAPVMPDCVGTMLLQLRPEDAEPTAVRTLDVSNMTYALINAVKELAAKVTALEARP